MTKMIGIRVSLVCLLALPALANAQSLGDVAKKERDRRDKLTTAGVGARTFTQQDLVTTKGSLANDPKEEPARTVDGETSKRGGQPIGSRVLPSGQQASPIAAQNTEEYWRARVAAARARIEEAQRRSDGIQRMIHIGQPARYDANGRRVIYSIEQMKVMADAAQAELASAQAALENVLEEGRRAGALPGWLR